MDIVKEVDARGLNCPLPILKAKKALADWLRTRGHEPVFFTPEENAERRRGLD